MLRAGLAIIDGSSVHLHGTVLRYKYQLRADGFLPRLPILVETAWMLDHFLSVHRQIALYLEHHHTFPRTSQETPLAHSMGFVRNLIYEQYFQSVPDPTASFAHKTVVITGANSGLGKEAARHIAKLGCPRLILGVRNVKAGEEARKEIIATTSSSLSSIEVWKVDLSDFASVRSFAERASRELDRLDVLICNAGINTFKYAELEGYESMLTVNVLSTYLMAKQFLPLLERTAAAGPVSGDREPRPPHLTIVGSDTHLMASFTERHESPATMLSAISASCRKSSSRFRGEYACSKLLILLLARDMVYRQRESGPSTGVRAVSNPEKKFPVIINVANPGLCYSNLVHEIAGPARIAYVIMRARPATMGGSAIVNGACAGWESNGQFLSSNKVHKGSDLSWDQVVGENVCKAVEEALVKASVAQK